MPELFSLESLIALAALTSLEIVLGVDNIVFIAIITGRLKKEIQAKARRVGLALAMIMRIALLLGISWATRLTTPLFSLAGFDFSGRKLILLIGGLFLLAKATHEIHAQMEPLDRPDREKAAPTYLSAVIQIGLLDIIFSLDSVITAVGMAQHLTIMIAAVVIAVAVMIVFAGPVSAFIERRPTMRVLALAFLILIGVMLVAEGLGQHLDKGYIYFAMAFALFVEMLNTRVRKRIVN